MPALLWPPGKPMKTIQHSRKRSLGRAMMIPALAAVCIGSGVAIAATRLPFTSGFEAGNFSEWNGGLDSSMTVTDVTATQGRYSTQAVMTLGQPADNYKDFVFGDHPRVGGIPVDRASGLWLALDSRFDAGFTFGPEVVVHKIAIINFENEAGRRRYQLIINVWARTGEYYIEHLKWNADGSFNRAMSPIAQNVGVPSQVRRGNWDRLKMFVRPNTRGQADGVVQFWVNGELRANYTSVALSEDTGYNPNKLIMSNYVPGTATAGVQRWDNFYLGESDPDGRPGPSAPVIRSVR